MTKHNIQKKPEHIWVWANDEEHKGFACNTPRCRGVGEVVLIEKGKEKDPHRSVFDVRCFHHVNEGKSY